MDKMPTFRREELKQEYREALLARDSTIKEAVGLIRRLLNTRSMGLTSRVEVSDVWIKDAEEFTATQE